MEKTFKVSVIGLMDEVTTLSLKNFKDKPDFKDFHVRLSRILLTEKKETRLVSYTLKEGQDIEIVKMSFQSISSESENASAFKIMFVGPNTKYHFISLIDTPEKLAAESKLLAEFLESLILNQLKKIFTLEKTFETDITGTLGKLQALATV